MKRFGFWGFLAVLCYFPLTIILPIGGLLYILKSLNVPNVFYYIISGIIGIWLAIQSEKK